MAGFRGGWRAQLCRHRPSDGCGDWTGTQLSSLAVCRSLSGSKSRSRPGGEARSISRAAGTSAAESCWWLLRTRDGAHDGPACSYSLPNELSLASGPCSTSWRDQQVCSVRRCLVWRSSWQPVRTSPACPPDTVLPRPCCRAAWNFVSDYREQNVVRGVGVASDRVEVGAMRRHQRVRESNRCLGTKNRNALSEHRTHEHERQKWTTRARVSGFGMESLSPTDGSRA